MSYKTHSRNWQIREIGKNSLICLIFSNFHIPLFGVSTVKCKKYSRKDCRKKFSALLQNLSFFDPLFGLSRTITEFRHLLKFPANNQNFVYFYCEYQLYLPFSNIWQRVIFSLCLSAQFFVVTKIYLLI